MRLIRSAIHTIPIIVIIIMSTRTTILSITTILALHLIVSREAGWVPVCTSFSWANHMEYSQVVRHRLLVKKCLVRSPWLENTPTPGPHSLGATKHGNTLTARGLGLLPTF